MTERPMTSSERQELPKLMQAFDILPDQDKEIIVAKAEFLAQMKAKGVDLSPLYESKAEQANN